MATVLWSLSAAELASSIRQEKLTPIEVVDAFIDRIETVNPSINAFVTRLDDEAFDEAREAQRALEAGEDVGPLHGVPVAVKDLYAFKRDVPHTFGSVPFESFVPDWDAPLVSRLEAAGAIVLGKTNTPEFGHKGNTVNDVVGQTTNPFSREHIPGGSSGGSAAAVASGMVPIAQGSDHAGSIRAPASACHLVGVFPSVGRVPHAFPDDAFRYHLPYAGSGPLTRTVEDAALMLDVIAGPHPHDPDSLPETDPSFRAAIDRPIASLTIGYDPHFRDLPVDSEVRTLVEETLTTLERAGATVEDVSVDFDDWDRLQDALISGLQVIFAETAHTLAEMTGISLLDHRDDVTPAVIDRIESGSQISALEYRRANVVRTSFYRAFAAIFDTVDVLVTPTTVAPPRRIDGEEPAAIDGTPLPPTHRTLLTWPINMTGNPAASVPAGLTDDGLPVGVQIVGPRFDEETVFAVAGAIERNRSWHEAYPLS